MVGPTVEGDVLVAGIRDAQLDLRAAVTALLPMVSSDQEGCRERLREALADSGIGSGSDRDLALIAGALQSARVFVLLAESMEVDPGRLWQTYLAHAA